MEQVSLKQVALLLIPAQEEEYLCLKRKAIRILIEILQERILLEAFKNDARTEGLSQHGGKRSLACTDNTFYGDVP